MQGECSSYPLCLVYWKDFAWIDWTEPSSLDLVKIRGHHFSSRNCSSCMKVSNSSGSERKKGTAFGCLVLRVVTQVLWYLDMSSCFTKCFILWKSFKHLESLGRDSKSREAQEDPLLGTERRWLNLDLPYLGEWCPCGVSGGCRAAQGMGISELV